jgi:hypothetical protein
MAGIDPAGTIPEGIEAQTEQALTDLAAVLEAAGVSMDDVVKTTIFTRTSRTSAASTRCTRGTCPIRRRRARPRPTCGFRAAYSSRSRRSRSSRPRS